MSKNVVESINFIAPCAVGLANLTSLRVKCLYYRKEFLIESKKITLLFVYQILEVLER